MNSIIQDIDSNRNTVLDEVPFVRDCALLVGNLQYKILNAYFETWLTPNYNLIYNDTILDLETHQFLVETREQTARQAMNKILGNDCGVRIEVYGVSGTYLCLIP
jgi:hypothetical protein